MRTLGVVKEMDAKESRVALVPEVVLALVKEKKASVMVEKNAGLRAGFTDDEYENCGAIIVSSAKDLIERSHYVVALNGRDVVAQGGGASNVIIGLFEPFFHQEEIRDACEKGITVVSLELIPRISRAQNIDVLSSQANIAGYVAVLVAAGRLPKVIPLMMTAAGTIKPAKILILGGGVAGLQAIATAKRLGAMVFAYDVRSAVKEQVESLGAKFIDLEIKEAGEGAGGYAKSLSEDAQQEQRQKLSHFAKDMDVIITTAQIPGKRAPLLLDDNVFAIMKKDTVIVDLAAASGGNVPGSIANEWVKKENVWLFGADHLARLAPKDASFTYAKNIKSFLDLLWAKEDLDLDDEILSASVICHHGSYVNKTFGDK